MRMRMRIFALTALLVLVLTGCSHQVYHGSIQAADAGGELRSVLDYWEGTERRFWFDTNSETLRLKTQCSTYIHLFREREDGVYMVWSPEWTGADPADEEGALCGRVIGATKIEDLGPGTIEVEIYCRPKLSAFALFPNNYLPPRPADAYQFEMAGEKRDTPPDVPDCPD